jgi:hypothetical protein
MIKRILNFFGDLKLTLWLMLAFAVFLIAGGITSLIDYEFINSMNGPRIQDWFLDKGTGEFHKSWWLAGLFISAGLLGANILVCSIERMAQLYKKKASISLEKFSVLITPSIIHIVFLFMLLGHLITFAGGYYVRLPISDGSEVALPGGSKIRIAAIAHDYHSEGTFMKGRIRQTHVTLEGISPVTAPTTLNFADPLSYNGITLQLDMKKRKEAVIERPVPESRESCNEEKHFKSDRKKQQNVAPELFLIAGVDPGLPVILTGFCLIIILMSWYYGHRQRYTE